LRKIRADLQRNIEEPDEENVNRLNPRYSHGVSSPGRHVRTRLYFTSESHIHSLLTVLRYGGLPLNDQQWRRAMEYVSMVSELNYMSQIVVMLYEDPTKEASSDERFHVELHFSPGVNCCVQKNLPPGPGFRPSSTQSKNPVSQLLSSLRKVQLKNISNFKSGEEDEVLLGGDDDTPLSVSKIEEENDQLSSMGMNDKKRPSKISNPIHIGAHHTVSGHEAMNLAKRLCEELATQQQQQQDPADQNQSQATTPVNLPRAISPESEQISRSYEGKKGNCNEPLSFSLVFDVFPNTTRNVLTCMCSV